MLLIPVPNIRKCYAEKWLLSGMGKECGVQRVSTVVPGTYPNIHTVYSDMGDGVYGNSVYHLNFSADLNYSFKVYNML